MVYQDGEADMSIKVMSYVWDNSKAKGSELLLLLAIADHSADDGYCWPTIDTLAHKTRLNKRSVMRLVQSLEDLGELYVVRSNRNNRYVVVMGKLQEDVDRILELRNEAAIGDKLSPDKMSRDTGVTSIGDMDVTSIGDTGVTLIINEPSCNRQEENPTDSDNTKPARKKPTANGIGPWFQALAAACSIDLNAATGRQKGMLKDSAMVMRDDVKTTPDQIAAFRQWWDTTDWRGKTGQAPTISQLREKWGEFAASDATGSQTVVRLRR